MFIESMTSILSSSILDLIRQQSLKTTQFPGHPQQNSVLFNNVFPTVAATGIPSIVTSQIFDQKKKLDSQAIQDLLSLIEKNRPANNVAVPSKGNGGAMIGQQTVQQHVKKRDEKMTGKIEQKEARNITGSNGGPQSTAKTHNTQLTPAAATKKSSPPKNQETKLFFQALMEREQEKKEELNRQNEMMEKLHSLLNHLRRQDSSQNVSQQPEQSKPKIETDQSSQNQSSQQQVCSSSSPSIQNQPNLNSVLASLTNASTLTSNVVAPVQQKQPSPHQKENNNIKEQFRQHMQQKEARSDQQMRQLAEHDLLRLRHMSHIKVNDTQYKNSIIPRLTTSNFRSQGSKKDNNKP